MSSIVNENVVLGGGVNESQNSPHSKGYDEDAPVEARPAEPLHGTDSTAHERAKESSASAARADGRDEEFSEAAGFAEQAEMDDEASLNEEAAAYWGAEERPNASELGGGTPGGAGERPKPSDDASRPAGEGGRYDSHERRPRGHPRPREIWPNHPSAPRENGSPYASMLRSRASTHTHGRSMSAQFDWTAQNLRYFSAVAWPRYHSARRAGSVNRFTGLPEAYARRLQLSESDMDAIDRMAMHDVRRQQAYERAQELELIRESCVVQTELEKERAAYDRWLELQSRQEELRYKRQIEGAKHLQRVEQRRAELERQRERLLQERLQRMESGMRRSSRASFNGSGWKTPNEGRAARRSGPNGSLPTSTRKTIKSSLNVENGSADADVERPRAIATVMHTRAWR